MMSFEEIDRAIFGRMTELIGILRDAYHANDDRDVREVPSSRKSGSWSATSR